MEVKDWTYEDFPEFTDLPEGAKRIETTGDEIGTYYAHDVEYAFIDGIHLKMQILIPLTRNNPIMKCPCFVYIQGSGWMEQDCYHSLGRIAKLSERGYVVAVVQYRYAKQAGFPAQIQDARNAVRYLRKNAEQIGIDPDKMFLGGTSSGGHTAVFAAIAGAGQDPFFDRNLYPGVSAGVIGVLDYYGCVSVRNKDDFPTNLEYEDVTELELFFKDMKGEPIDQLLEKATALNYINRELDLPPFFIIHGSKDRIVNTRASRELYEKLKECGKDVRFFVLGGADHGGPEFWSKPVVDQADEFMKYCCNMQ